jgi:tight adherence protein B
MALLLAACAGIGAYLLVARSDRRTDPAIDGADATSSPRTGTARHGVGSTEWLAQRLTAAGLGEVRPVEVVAVVAVLFVVSAALGYAFFGGVFAALVIGGFAAWWPVGVYRRRAQTRRAVAMEAWPRMIEEIRILTASAGRSIPQALFEVGRRAPDALRPAFTAAQREWVLTTDFARTLSLLKAGLADPAADATCETLLIAHEIGGTDLDARLDALAEDRRQEVQGRKDARARQAGVRFARRFVLLVPLGMALAGTSVGTGRAAYQTPLGQVLVAAALLLVAACWWWSGLLMRLPESERVFPT